jgi:plasmid stabilization system protein ParE
MGKKEKPASEARKIRVHEQAYNDIDQLTDFIAIASQQPLNAVKVADAIFQKLDNIAKNPFAYRECEALPTKGKIYRQASCLSWLIIYKITDAEIIILGIIHTSRRPSRIKRLRSAK